MLAGHVLCVLIGGLSAEHTCPSSRCASFTPVCLAAASLHMNTFPFLPRAPLPFIVSSLSCVPLPHTLSHHDTYVFVCVCARDGCLVNQMWDLA